MAAPHCSSWAANLTIGKVWPRLVENPPPERMLGPWETMALASAVLVVLQTHFKFERDKQGRWTVNLEKKPTDAQLLKLVIQKLLGIWPKSGTTFIHLEIPCTV